MLPDRREPSSTEAKIAAFRDTGALILQAERV
jgi:hypothetical protein